MVRQHLLSSLRVVSGRGSRGWALRGLVRFVGGIVVLMVYWCPSCSQLLLLPPFLMPAMTMRAVRAGWWLGGVDGLQTNMALDRSWLLGLHSGIFGFHRLVREVSVLFCVLFVLCAAKWHVP